MADRADAHIHLFEGGYRSSFTGRPGVQVDEAALYDSLAREHGVRRALVVGYADAPWCRGNNAWILARASEYAWARPLAYADPLDPPDLPALERLGAGGAVGLSLYILGEERAAGLARVPAAAWGWLAERGWLVSVNSRPALWPAWEAVLRQHPGLRLLAAHLGQPPRAGRPPATRAAADALAGLIALARYPGVHVKVSGFYAFSEPGFAYPHRAVWPYVEALLAAFGPERLLWASDYSPCLDMVSFPQTLGLLAEMPFLGAAERRAIEGGNLLALLGAE